MGENFAGRALEPSVPVSVSSLRSWDGTGAESETGATQITLMFLRKESLPSEDHKRSNENMVSYSSERK